MQAATAQRIPRHSAESFLQSTKPKSVKITTAQAYVDNGTQSWQLPSAGLGSTLYFHILGTVTVAGTVTSGTFKKGAAPAPWSLIKRMQFGSNNAFNMRSLSGWAWYKWVRARYGIDPTASVGVTYSANTTAALGLTGSTRITPGANIAAQAYQVNLCLPMPLAYNDAAETGLIVLQLNNTFYNVTIDWGQITGGISATGGSNDFFASLVGTSLVITSSITTTISLDWFEALPGVDDLISLFMSVSEFTQNSLQNGTNTVKLPPNDYYTLLMMEVINNGDVLAVANIGNPTFLHSGNVYDLQEDYYTHLTKYYYKHGIPPQDSLITYDFGIRRGLLSRRDAIDAFDNQNITDAQMRFDLPAALSITGTNQVSILLESLRYIEQV
jgi:hypothetical protein